MTPYLTIKEAKMVFRIEWKYREAMVKRGARMLEAHWRNRLESDDLDRWFTRTLPRYAASVMGPKLTDNRERVAQRFWLDCEKRVWQQYGYDWRER